MKSSKQENLIFVKGVYLTGESKKTGSEYSVYLVTLIQPDESPNLGGPAKRVIGSYTFDASCEKEVFDQLEPLKGGTEVKARINSVGNSFKIEEVTVPKDLSVPSATSR